MNWLIPSLIDWLIDRLLINMLVEWVDDLLLDGRVNEWLIDRLVAILNDCIINGLIALIYWLFTYLQLMCWRVLISRMTLSGIPSSSDFRSSFFKATFLPVGKWIPFRTRPWAPSPIRPVIEYLSISLSMVISSSWQPKISTKMA